MGQTTSGMHRILNLPFIYELLQEIAGARKARARFVKELVKPFPGSRILDIGCGPAKILEFFPASVDYVGIDQNPRYISSAKRRYRGKAQFLCSDVGGLSRYSLSANYFDIALAIGVLHHLDDEEAELLFKNTYYYLRKGGFLVSIDPVYIPGQSRIARYIISKDRGKNVRTPEGYTMLAQKSFSSVKTTILNDMGRIPYNHFVMRLIKS